jgi:hypothetical protein
MHPASIFDAILGLSVRRAASVPLQAAAGPHVPTFQIGGAHDPRRAACAPAKQAALPGACHDGEAGKTSADHRHILVDLARG